MGDVFKALADPTRRKILDELADRDGQTLFEICNRLIMRHQISCSRQAISQHLDLLEAAGLVHTRRDGRHKFHYLDTALLDRIEFKWLTVVSPEDPDGVELVLEPSDHPAVKPFKDAIVADGIPYTSFAVADVQAEYERLSARGVKFVQEPTSVGPVTTAVFDDTCGNLIQIAAMN
jgi:DNA-binding transcriptional ArsR family regulator